MRHLLVLAITFLVLLAFGVACGGDEKDAQVIPSPATESERGGEDSEGVEWEAGEGAEEEGAGIAEETDAEPEAAEEEEPPVATYDSDHDAVQERDDLCPDTAPGSVVDDVGCSDAQVDQDNDGICEPAVPSDGPGDCDLIDDNCPETSNPDQADFDGDLAGDACDPDDDDDGFTDADEDDYGSHPYDAARTPESSDLDLASCHDGVDNDGDGRIDLADDGCI